MPKWFAKPIQVAFSTVDLLRFAEAVQACMIPIEMGKLKLVRGRPRLQPIQLGSQSPRDEIHGFLRSSASIQQTLLWPLPRSKAEVWMIRHYRSWRMAVSEFFAR